MSYIKLAISIINFLIHLMRFLEKAEEKTAKSKAAKINQFKKALEDAGNGNTKSLEEMFTIVRDSPGVQDKS